MLSQTAKTLARNLAAPIARLLLRLGVTPNQLTVFGFLLNLLVAAVLATGNLLAGGLLLLIAGAFDTLDGSVARLGGKASVFGGFLDSTLDRYSEAASLLGLLYLYTVQGQPLESLLVFITAVGSLMVSYTRARAEGLGLSCEVGLLQRPERIVLLAIGLITGLVLPALIILAVMTNVTTLQRILHVKRLTESDGNSGVGR